MNLTDAQRDELVNVATAVRRNAHAPYSNFQVGAAVLAVSGEVFAGCNVENASYGLTICAERVAICSAVAAGHREIAAVAVATIGGASPCGACRQFIAEFCADASVVLCDVEDGGVSELQLSELLPHRFDLRG